MKFYWEFLVSVFCGDKFTGIHCSEVHEFSTMEVMVSYRFLNFDLMISYFFILSMVYSEMTLLLLNFLLYSFCAHKIFDFGPPRKLVFGAGEIFL